MLSFQFQEPRKVLLTPEQLAAFQDSDTYNVIINYIEELNESAVNAKLSDECTESEVGWFS